MDEETAIRFCDSRNGFATRDKGFLAELTAARRAGVTLSANLPFLLFPKSAPKTGVLLVHGFSASPREMYGVGERLAEAGYVALGVRLPGHGTSPADLRTRRFEEWLQTV
ncbi:MAG TPA: hypothetical protein VJ955_08260, partial [Desulfuromonadales bacterium]|nr:hypothetical protein [Desulfuromonadales bacterium]